jgi:hypothetical protein
VWETNASFDTLQLRITVASLLIKDEITGRRALASPAAATRGTMTRSAPHHD